MSQFKYRVVCSLVVSSLLLSACAQAPQRTSPVSQTGAPQAETPHPVAQSEAPVEPALVLPNVALSDELLYEFLLSEIASQRGHAALAMEGSVDIARKTRDPRLARRAAQLSLESGQMDKAIAAFRLWQETEPTSTMATRMLSTILLRGGKLDEAKPEFVKVLKEDEANAGRTFLQVYQLLASYPDKQAALKLMRELAAPYPKVAESHWAMAQLAQASGDGEVALSEVRQARSLRPEWDMAVSLEAQLLQKKAPQQGLDVLRGYLAAYPNSREIRLQHARALLEQKQYKPSREEFQRLSKDYPDNTELIFAVALISLQMQDLSGAEAQLKQALGGDKKEQDTVMYYLGQLSEAKKNDEEALAYYRGVQAGDYLFAAQMRIAYLLGKRGKLDDARQYLHQAQVASNQQRVQLLLVEAQLLREANRLPETYLVLQQGLAKLPNHPDLLYEAAMLADRLGKPDVFEQLMRKLIQIKPDHAHAYNALGYSLLERNQRIPEAVTLVEKALQLAPKDPAIMDSVGWGYYRTGKLDESVKLLRNAFAENPDPEIASHLGEVLWVRGDKEEAMKIWQDSLKANPGNAQLQAVMKRFMP
ncbi:MAG TPA: tetratricopeptide repeat protein [Gallionella sp.]|nr:tetratricopeptide repeat protein [Gallionella sp.]